MAQRTHAETTPDRVPMTSRLEAGAGQKDRMSMIVFSGTVDKLYPVAIMASGAVMMEQEVEIFLTFWGLLAFRKGAAETNTRVSADMADLAPRMMQAMREKRVPSWLHTLRQAKELGRVKVHACGMTMDLLGLTLADLEDIVDDVVGVGEFVDRAKDGKMTLFI